MHDQTLPQTVELTAAPLTSSSPVRRPLRYHDRAIFTDLDECLLTDPQGLPSLIELIRAQHKVATLRHCHRQTPGLRAEHDQASSHLRTARAHH
ncbi:MAG: hypothetical protein ACI9DC_005708 [Gammaproteobacteria bacterium]|jgi:hypothetical protein